MTELDWVKLFWESNPIITTQFSSNIKIVRAAVYKEIIKEYQDNLAEKVENIPSIHIQDTFVKHLLEKYKDVEGVNAGKQGMKNSK